MQIDAKMQLASEAKGIFRKTDAQYKRYAPIRKIHPWNEVVCLKQKFG
jgi:hypothetical protein